MRPSTIAELEGVGQPRQEERTAPDPIGKFDAAGSGVLAMGDESPPADLPTTVWPPW